MTLKPPFPSQVCAAWSDLFYAPRRTWAPFALLSRTHFKDAHHEVGVPTVLRTLEVLEGHPPVVALDCWGCSQAWARDPAVIDAYACGHRIDLQLEHVRHAYQALLDDMPPAKPRDADLERAIADLDATQGAWDRKDRYWLAQSGNKWTSGCCALKSPDQTACNCVALNPPDQSPEANRFPSHCDNPGLVRTRLPEGPEWRST